MSDQSRIEYSHVGIGDALKRHRLAVPLNQREYSWEEKQVTDLLQDLSNAINDNKPGYFLGTLVLTKSPTGQLEVVDGQQRLATISVLLAAIRDYFHSLADEMLIQHMEVFLFTIDPKARARVPLLSLNVDDNEFFHHRIIEPPNSKLRKKVKATKDSHKRLEHAAELAAQHIADIVKPLKGENRVSMLTAWSEYIQSGADVIMLSAPDDVNAFVMFETLNDRGLRTTQADLLKNYLFATSSTRINEAQNKWSSMRGTLESLGDDVTLTYLRHHIISQFGYTTERQVLESIRARIKNQVKAIDFIGSLADGAVDYVAIQTPEHAKWNKYGPSVRNQIRTLGMLPVTPLRPLMLSVARFFSAKNAEAAFGLFISWSVRFLITGGSRSGTVEKAFAERAKEVSEGAITSSTQLASAMASVVPSDAAFESAFATARVTSGKLARYYLRSLEMQKKGLSEPELIPNDDIVVNLEHVLPQSPSDGWDQFDTETIPAYCQRIGNLALMKASGNQIIGNSRFDDKRPHFKSSALLLTKEIAIQKVWGPEQIDDRQRELAELAVETWPLS